MNPSLDTSPRDAFLQHVAKEQRSTISNFFLSCGPRAGLTDPAAIVQAVVSDLHKRLCRAWSAESAQKLGHLLAAVEAHPEEAKACARYYVEYEQMPSDQRQAVKEANAAEHVERWMAEHPPSQKQIDYLRSLGVNGPIANMQQASELIDARRRMRGGAR